MGGELLDRVGMLWYGKTRDPRKMKINYLLLRKQM